MLHLFCDSELTIIFQGCSVAGKRRREPMDGYKRETIWPRYDAVERDWQYVAGRSHQSLEWGIASIS